MTDIRKWVGDYAPRDYDPMEVEVLVREVYDHATAAGHILADWELHPVYGTVRLWRCSGCEAVYRLCLPGRTVADWDAAGVGCPPGICPASFAGVSEQAWGPEGGLVLWYRGRTEETARYDVSVHLFDTSHTPYTLLERPVKVLGSFTNTPQSMPLLWRCDKCGRLVAKCAYLPDGSCELLLTHQMCSGRNVTLRGKR